MNKYYIITGDCPNCGTHVTMVNARFEHNCLVTGEKYCNSNKVFVHYFDNIQNCDAELVQEKTQLIEDDIF